MANILISTLSPVIDKRVNNSYKSNIGQKNYEADQSNLAPAYYVIDNSIGKHIDKVYAIASKKVRSKFAVNNPNNETSLEYYSNRICEYCDRNKIERPEFEYIDVSDNMDTEDISGIINRIVCDAEPEDDIFFDITGGDRNIGMIAVSIIRLLEITSPGIKTPKFVFAQLPRQEQKNPNKPVYGFVTDNLSLYSIYDAIIGADEYSRSGKVDRLKNCFGKLNCKEIDAVLDAVEKLNNNILICNINSFDDDIKNAIKMVNTYSSADTTEYDSSMTCIFDYVADFIKASFAEIVDSQDQSDGKSSLNKKIDWCLKNSYIQQALTLLVEYLPYEICTSALIEPSADFESQSNINPQYKQTWYAYFIKDLSRNYRSQESISRLLERDSIRVHIPTKKQGSSYIFSLTKILDLYNNICLYRNSTNHANTTEGKKQFTVASVKGVISETMSYLNKFCSEYAYTGSERRLFTDNKNGHTVKYYFPKK